MFKQMDIEQKKREIERETERERGREGEER